MTSISRCHATGGAWRALPALALLAALVLASLAPAAFTDSAAAPAAEPVKKDRTDKNPMPEGWAAPDQEAARQRASLRLPLVKEVLDEDMALRQQRLRKLGIGMKDIDNSYVYLESDLVNAYENQYEPVRFMHSKHAAVLEGNCVLCHHHRPADDKAPETVACRSCHQEPFNESTPGRVGLKAAYHMRCVSCHETMKQGPVSCDSCHRRQATDHKDLVVLPDDPTPEQVTTECLRCHEQAGQDMLKSAHWLWRGPSLFTVDKQKDVLSGKGTNAINNF